MKTTVIAWSVAGAVLVTVCSLNGQSLPEDGVEPSRSRRMKQTESKSSGNTQTKKEREETFLPPAEVKLNRKLQERERTIRALLERLQSANAEAEAAKRELEERNIRDAALGIELLTGDQKRIQQKLLNALRDLYAAEEARKTLMAHLSATINWLEKLLQSGIQLSPEERAKLEAQLRDARQILEKNGKDQLPEAENLLRARVLHVNRDLGLLILNVGWVHEAKSGMIFEIIRQGKRIGMARLVDIRERLSGALIEQENEELPINTGDDARVKTSKE